MKKLLLTSTGFGNKDFAKLFLTKVGKSAETIRAIYVPSAATTDDAREMLPYCYNDLINTGILSENIFTYHLGYLMSNTCERASKAGQLDMHPMFRLLSLDELKQYDVIYFCGGDPVHLLNEVNRTGLAENLKQAVESGLFYIGTSAGAIIAAGNLPNNLGYIGNRLNVHCESGTFCGALPENETINLSNTQAIYIEDDSASIIE